MTIRDDIQAIIESLVDKEPESFSGVGNWASPWTKGTIQRRDRLVAIANYAVERFEGDFVEIGCYCGQTTILLAQIAEKHGRRVIGVDPWEVGRANCDGHEYGIFMEAIEPWKDLIDVIRLPSEDEKAIEYVKARELCFSYVDGMHDYDHCYPDILTCGHSAVIAVDDIIWNPDVERAFYDGLAELGREGIKHDMTTEGYIV